MIKILREAKAAPVAEVVCVCNKLVARYGSRVRIFVDNGNEFSGRLFDLRAHHQKATIGFNRPGKRMDNGFVESFNGSFRDECLDVHWFEMLEQAKAKIEAWRVGYNESRPHETLKDVLPSEYALKCRPIEMDEVVQQAENWS